MIFYNDAKPLTGWYPWASMLLQFTPQMSGLATTLCLYWLKNGFETKGKIWQRQTSRSTIRGGREIGAEQVLQVRRSEKVH